MVIFERPNPIMFRCQLLSDIDIDGGHEKAWKGCHMIMVSMWEGCTCGWCRGEGSVGMWVCIQGGCVCMLREVLNW